MAFSLRQPVFPRLDRPAPAVTRSSPYQRPIVRVLAGSLLFAGLAILRYAMTTGAFRNSDDASNFLAGVEMAEGNWRLHGWILAPDNYYPTDVLGQAVLRLLFGYHPVFMELLEALIWAAIAVVGTGLAILGATPRHRLGIVSLALALLAFNSFEHRFRDVFLFSVASHGFTILLMLLAFTVVATGQPGPTGVASRPPPRQAVLLGLVVMIGSFADPIFNVVACLPILAISLLGLGVRNRRRALLLQAGTTLGAVLLAHGLLTALSHNGGFSSVRLSVTLASFTDWFAHSVFALEATIRLLGAEFFGRSLDQPLRDGPAIYLLRVPLVLAYLAACWEVGRGVLRSLRRWPDARPPPPGRELDQLLWLSLALCIAATVMTTVLIDPTCARFFLPSTVAGSILAARRFGRLPLAACYGVTVAALSLAFAILALPAGSSPGSTIAIAQETAVIEALKRHGLRHGYAGYWESTMTTAMADRTITSLALIEGGDHRLHTLNWFCNLDWFREAARTWQGRIFFIVTSEAAPGPLELTPSMVTGQFGRPAEAIDTGQFTIEVYDLRNNQLQSLVP